jgi:hypothetical protein
MTRSVTHTALGISTNFLAIPKEISSYGTSAIVVLPAIMPSTGTPEPNGLFWTETVELLKRVGREKHIVGCDVVELAPRRGLTHPDLTAAKLTYKLMNCAFISKE